MPKDLRDGAIACMATKYQTAAVVAEEGKQEDLGRRHESYLGLDLKEGGCVPCEVVKLNLSHTQHALLCR